MNLRLCCRHNLCCTLWYYNIIHALPNILIEIYCVGFIALKGLCAETILDENDFWAECGCFYDPCNDDVLQSSLSRIVNGNAVRASKHVYSV